MTETKNMIAELIAKLRAPLNATYVKHMREHNVHTWALLKERLEAADALEALQAENERLRGLDENKCAQAYQVISNLLAHCDLFGSDEGQRALDYFSDNSSFEDEFLPWPRS